MVAKNARLTVPEIRARKTGAPLVVLTCYSKPMAESLDAAVDILLVGDSLGMVLYGERDTLAVSVDTMIRHGAAVVRGRTKALVVIDMPFGSYQQNPAQAFENAARMIAETGADAVKLEGGLVMAETIRFLVDRGIPVMAHVGMTPQSYHAFGGFKKQGSESDAAGRIMQDAEAVSKAGAFAVVLEHIEPLLAKEITGAIAIPTIGIGAGADCDGQVLVTEDMLGLTSWSPPFVKKFASLGAEIQKAAMAYAEAVRNKKL